MGSHRVHLGFFLVPRLVVAAAVVEVVVAEAAAAVVVVAVANYDVECYI